MEGEPPLLVMKDPSRWGLGALAVIWLAIAVAVLSSDVRHGGVRAAGAGFAFLLPGVLFAVFARHLWHPAILTREELQVPALLHDRHIPVADIAGVGLCLISGARSSTWCTTIWTASGQRIYVVHYLAVGWKVEKSPAAKQTAELWQAVAGLQGSSGPLVTRALQHGEAGSVWAMITRIYCPDDGSVRRP